MILPLAVFMQMAVTCGPAVHPNTLAAVARAESGFHTGAIHDNTSGRSYRPESREEATRIATDLVLRQGHSIDLGLMQINSRNLGWLGMTVEEAFDACRSISAGARVLVTGYRPEPGEDHQEALARALSRYNTGHPERGLANGYVMRVRDAAEVVVPAIRLRGETGASPAAPVRLAPAAEPEDPNAPPAWDVWARAAYARRALGRREAWPETGAPPSLQERTQE